jgi:hypothetical protein
MGLSTADAAAVYFCSMLLVILCYVLCLAPALLSTCIKPFCLLQWDCMMACSEQLLHMLFIEYCCIEAARCYCMACMGYLATLLKQQMAGTVLQGCSAFQGCSALEHYARGYIGGPAVLGHSGKACHKLLRRFIVRVVSQCMPTVAAGACCCTCSACFGLITHCVDGSVGATHSVPRHMRLLVLMLI